MAGEKQQTISECLSEFCKFCNEVDQAYTYNYNEVNRLDQKTQDYLHILELKASNYKERAKVATKLSRCRQERRELKDFLEDAQNLVNFLRSDKGVSLMKSLSAVIGNTRKAEEYHKTREYKFRILNDDYKEQAD